MAPSFKGTFKVCKRYPNTDCIEQAKQSLLKNDTFFSEKQRVSYIFDFYFSFLKAGSIECCRGNVSGSGTKSCDLSSGISEKGVELRPF